MEIKGIYDIAKAINSFESSETVYLNSGNISLAVIGEKPDKTAKEIADNFKTSGSDIAGKINELFLTAIFDKESGVLHILSDLFSSPYNLYYTVADSKFYYSSSLKWLLKVSGIKRELDQDAVSYFKINGFVLGDKTLIKGVNKLGYAEEIIVSKNGVSKKALKYTFNYQQKPAARAKLINTVRESIRNSSGISEPCIALSSGYDSNMVLDTLRKVPDTFVHAFSVGGETGRNETVAVSENVKNMSGVDLSVSIVNRDNFNTLADIVWRLEGSVFERGIILQYALAKSISEYGIENPVCICGECADQVMNRNFRDDMNKTLSGKNRPDQRLLYNYNPFVTGTTIILKKSSLMLNSFGITSRYPFIKKNVLENTVPLGKENGLGKNLYRKLCANELPDFVLKNISMVGGSTNNNAILNEEDYAKLKAGLKRSPVVAKITTQTVPRYISFVEQTHRVKGVLKRYFSSLKPKKGEDKKPFTLKTNDMTEELMSVYLLLFYELFITGNHDDAFDKVSSPLNTKEILNIYDI